MSTIEAGKLFGRDLHLLLFAEREDDERREPTEQSDTDHPPDMPDQGKAGDDGKEGVDEADRAVPRHLDRRIFASLARLRPGRPCTLLRLPIGVSLRDLG